jgi:hypothetical protein
VFPDARIGLGVVSEWAARSDRREPWPVMAAGPVMRYRMLVWRRQSFVPLIMSVDTGIEFGSVSTGRKDQALPFGTSRSELSPNAAAFAGITPRVLMLRRLHVDSPLRLYWLHRTPRCNVVPRQTRCTALPFVWAGPETGPHDNRTINDDAPDWRSRDEILVSPSMWYLQESRRTAA